VGRTGLVVEQQQPAGDPAPVEPTGPEIGGHIEFIRHRIGGIIVVLAQLEDRPAGQGWS